MMDYAKEYDRIVEQSNDQQIQLEQLEAENARLREELAAAQERIKDLIAGDVMHEPNWSNCNEV